MYVRSPSAFPSSVAFGAGPYDARILVVSDLHDNLRNIAKTKTVMDTLTDEAGEKNQRVYRIHCGDISAHGNPENWNLAVLLMKQFRFQANIIGNHETRIPVRDFVDGLLAHVGRSLGRGFYLASNLKKPVSDYYQKLLDRNLVQTDSLVVDRGPAKFGFISALGNSKNPRAHSLPLDNKATCEKIQKEAARLKKEEKVDVVVLVSHRGYSWDVDFAKQPAAENIDVIVGGRSHMATQEIEEGKTLFTKPNGKQILVTNASAYGRHVGVLDLRVDESGRIIFKRLEMKPTEGVERDTTIQALIRKFKGMDSLLPLYRVKAGYYKEDYLDQLHFMADLMKQKVNADVGMVSSDVIRWPLRKNVTPVDLDGAFSENQPVVKVEMTGETLLSILVENTQYMQSPAPTGLKFFAGITYNIDPSTGAHHASANNIMLNGNPIDLKKTYTVATTEPLARYKLVSGVHRPAGFRVLDSEPGQSTETPRQLMEAALSEMQNKTNKTQPVKIPSLPDAMSWLYGLQAHKF
ncbi:MAG: 5'-nucleotidase C-terminal domain-containing protein [Vampirovibrio sp.]|nr:5'-nucleotidase C-terminal domain-containing protein [Vampirovibrio sp.]